ncbi:MAG: HAMP domain-containing histidine kinase [Ignavibacteriales bacterium]|nr:HAMP domain-containing histidine kinase [Ignavibacteriales bacterium]
MRLLKENTAHIVPLYQVLAANNNASGSNRSWQSGSRLRKAEAAVPEKYGFMTELFTKFEDDIAVLTDPIEMLELLKQALRKVIPVKEAALFNFDTSGASLHPYKLIPAAEYVVSVNRYWKEGILDDMFETRETVVFPMLSAYNQNGASLNAIIIPQFDGSRRAGVFAIFTPIRKDFLGKFEKDALKMIARAGLTKIEINTLRDKLNHSYSEIQTYQAKLSNDFRLSAVGEMTGGILEDIGTPLQVIVSAADLISDDEGNASISGRIKNQVSKIQQTIRRLVKFAELNQKNITILPCNLNDIINDYHQLVRTSLDNLGIECVLNLEDTLPPVLSHSNYIYQILANVFGLVKSFLRESGGIVLQTSVDDEAVMVRIINTANLEALASKEKSRLKIENLNFRIITNLMNKHEGTCTIESAGQDGSTIMLRFPIRRKLR